MQHCSKSIFKESTVKCVSSSSSSTSVKKTHFHSALYTPQQLHNDQITQKNTPSISDIASSSAAASSSSVATTQSPRYVPPNPLLPNDKSLTEQHLSQFIEDGNLSVARDIFLKNYQWFPESERQKRERLLKERNLKVDVLFTKVPQKYDRYGNRYSPKRIFTKNYPDLKPRFPMTLDVFEQTIKLFGYKSLADLKGLMVNALAMFGDAVYHHTASQCAYSDALVHHGRNDAAFIILKQLLKKKIPEEDLFSKRLYEGQLGDRFAQSVCNALFRTEKNISLKFASNIASILENVQKEGLASSVPRERIATATSMLRAILSKDASLLNDIFKNAETYISTPEDILSTKEKKFVFHFLNNNLELPSELKTASSSIDLPKYALKRDDLKSLVRPKKKSNAIEHTDKKVVRNAVQVHLSRGTSINHPMFRLRKAPPPKGDSKIRRRRRIKRYHQKVGTGRIVFVGPKRRALPAEAAAKYLENEELNAARQREKQEGLEASNNDEKFTEKKEESL